MNNLMYDDGTITLHVQGDASRAFSFNPSDPKILSGFFCFLEAAEAKVIEFSGAEKTSKENADPTEAVSEIAALLMDVDRWVREEFDGVFGKGTSDIVFGGVSTTATASNGDYIFSNMLMSLYPYFVEYAEKREKELDGLITAKLQELGGEAGEVTDNDQTDAAEGN